MVSFAQNIVTKLKRRIYRTPFKKKKQHKSTRENYNKILESNKNPSNKKLTIGIISIINICGIVILYVLITIIIAIIQFLPQEYPYTSKSKDNSTFQGDKKTILVFALDRTDNSHMFVDGIAVINYNYISKKIAIFSLNSDLKVYSAMLGRDVNIRTSFNDIVDKTQRINIITNALESLLAIKIDNYVVFDIRSFNNFARFFPLIKMQVDKPLKDVDTVDLPNKKYKEWGSGDNFINGSDVIEFLASDDNGEDDQLNRQVIYIKKLIENTFNLSLLVNIPQILKEIESSYFYTDLKKEEMIGILWNLAQVKENDVKTGFTQFSVYSRVYSVSYYPVYIVNYIKLDQDISSIFFDLNIFKEQARIELLNGSSIKGLAANRARWITNIGARVINVGNSYENEQKTKIYCDNPQMFIFTIKELQRIFDNKALLIKKDYSGRHVGDIIIVIGND